MKTLAPNGLSAMRDVASPFTDQALSEPISFRHLRKSNETRCAEQAKASLNGKGAEPERLAHWRLGCAHTAAHCWDKEEARHLAPELMEMLGPAADMAIAETLGTAFWLADPLPLNASAQMLFKVLPDAPHLRGKAHASFLVEALSPALLQTFEWLARKIFQPETLPPRIDFGIQFQLNTKYKDGRRSVPKHQGQ